jgi:hypothetical protein
VILLRGGKAEIGRTGRYTRPGMIYIYMACQDQK